VPGPADGPVRAAVLGSPVAHSLSPVLHRAAYAELGLANWSYDAAECDEAGLSALIGSLGPEWAGLSLTMPLKRAVLPLLDSAGPLVREVGGANTVLLAGGRRGGQRTDVPGMAAALAQAGVSGAGRVAVTGAGATACSALAALGDNQSGEVTVAVRSPQRAQELMAVAGRLGAAVRLVPLDALAAAGPWDLLISTVPGRAADPLAVQLAAGQLRAEAVFDVVYDPWPTALADAASTAGATVISGYELLLQQAALQVELMTGHPAPVGAMRAAGLAELERRRQSRPAEAAAG
jgi:shikimate dehydrogenase